MHRSVRIFPATNAQQSAGPISQQCVLQRLHILGAGDRPSKGTSNALWPMLSASAPTLAASPTGRHRPLTISKGLLCNIGSRKRRSSMLNLAISTRISLILHHSDESYSAILSLCVIAALRETSVHGNPAVLPRSKHRSRQQYSVCHWPRQCKRST